MLAGSKEESQTAAWAKTKKKVWQAAVIQTCRVPTSRGASKEKSMFHSWEKLCLFRQETLVKYPCCSTEIGFREISQCVTVSNILLRYFCILWITGAVKTFTWAQNHLETEGKKTSKVSAAFYPVSASKMFLGNGRCEKSSSHYWQWKPLRHFRCMIAFN